jgi:alginate O-acetyltransferase complex protein AlgJ
MTPKAAIAEAPPPGLPHPAPETLMHEAQMRRPAAILLFASFAILLAVPAAVQWCLHPADENARFEVLLRALPTFPPPVALVNWADQLSRESVVGRLVRRYYQLGLTAWLGKGSAKVVVGRDGWLFLREDLNLSTGTAILNERLDPSKRKPEPEDPDSVAVIQAYDQLLRERGIHLVVLPVPTGPVLYPEKIWPNYPVEAGPAWPPDYDIWKKRVRSAGVDLLDVTDDLWQAKGDTTPVWLRNNTHWSPRGVEVTADKIAGHIRPLLEPFAARKYRTRRVDHLAASDLAPMLDLPRGDLYPPVPCEVVQVFKGDEFAAGDDDSAVLLLGDSFTLIYGGEDANDVRGADLGRQLMLRLGGDVQIIAYEGDDPTRLRWRLGSHGRCLDAKKVVVWEFATRYLHDPIVWKYERIPPVGGVQAAK